jgi:hypothetical protein
MKAMSAHFHLPLFDYNDEPPPQTQLGLGIIDIWSRPQEEAESPATTQPVVETTNVPNSSKTAVISDDALTLVDRIWASRPAKVTISSESIMALSKRDAQSLLDCLQKVCKAPLTAHLDRLNLLQHLDNTRVHYPAHPQTSAPQRSEAESRRRTIRLLIRLSKRYGVLPSNLYVENIICRDKIDPACHGGFADIFLGEMDGTKVAVKRLRTYVLTPRDREELHKVWPLL